MTDREQTRSPFPKEIEALLSSIRMGQASIRELRASSMVMSSFRWAYLFFRAFCRALTATMAECSSGAPQLAM